MRNLRLSEVFPHLKPKAAITRNGNPAATLPRFVSADDVAAAWPHVESMFRSLAEALKTVDPVEPVDTPPEESDDE